MNKGRLRFAHVRFAMLALLPVVPLLATWPGPASQPAAGAFPGKNGKLVVASNLKYLHNPEGDYEIYAVNPDGSGLTQLTDNTADDYDPAWSPHGKRIVFVSFRDGNDENHTMKSTGADQTKLTDDPAPDVEPVWSPDGTTIAFVSFRNGNQEIYTMSATGADQKNLTNDPDLDSSPARSPDGKKVVFMSDADVDFDIYTMSVAGTSPEKLAKLTKNEAGDSNPDWQPKP